VIREDKIGRKGDILVPLYTTIMCTRTVARLLVRHQVSDPTWTAVLER
jgi:hypothetical protein